MNPLQKVIDFQKQALENNDSSADLCFLSTVDLDNNPHVRIIELKEILNDKISLLISNTSPKWKQLKFSETFEILLFWSSIPVQIRINGEFIKMSREDEEKFWKKKKYNFKILDYLHYKVNDQSSSIGTLNNYLELIKAIKSEFPDSDELKMPDTILGIEIIPSKIDIWDGREEIAQREVFQIKDGNWRQSFLIP